MPNENYVTLYLDVPICPKCNSIMKRQQGLQHNELICWDCKTKYELIDEGLSDKCMLAREIKN